MRITARPSGVGSAMNVEPSSAEYVCVVAADRAHVVVRGHGPEAGAFSPSRSCQYTGALWRSQVKDSWGTSVAHASSMRSIDGRATAGALMVAIVPSNVRLVNHLSR